MLLYAPNLTFYLLPDVTKKLREKDTEIVNNKATVTRLEGRLHEMELANKKDKLNAELEIKTLKHRHQRDKELVGVCWTLLMKADKK